MEKTMVRQAVPLQPMEKTMVRQAVPLQPMEIHGGADIHLQPVEDPMPEQFMKNCSPWEGLMLEKSMEDCLLWEGPHAGAGAE
ncbi:tRNA:m(4)X modification enzyme TRM13 [Grus japonensis]|uniref:tRNA:m(4)X modification enzyme TRM13 n=1 Tax=Grus japonensis TaxID=30415 RepID=A0ABC9W6E7_GRUJA